MTFVTVAAVALMGLTSAALAREPLESDVLATSAGALRLTFVGHGSLIFQFGGKTIYVDPCSLYGNYTNQPPADAIFVTHEHGDHLDPATIRLLHTPQTVLVVAPGCPAQVPDGIVMSNGETRTVLGFQVEAVPAYNLIHRGPNGQLFHPRGRGNGYIFTFGDRRVYVAGDTENTLEMKALTGIDVAFLPMNLPYTMTPEMVADAAKAFRPKILYLYHYGESTPQDLIDLMKGEKDIEIRIRKLR